MSESIKVFELAKELNLKALELLDKVKPLDLKLKNHMADLSAEQADQIRNFINPPKALDADPKKKTVVRRKVAKADAAPAAGKSVVIRRAGSKASEAPVSEAASPDTSPVLEGSPEPEQTMETAPQVGEEAAAPQAEVREMPAAEATDPQPAAPAAANRRGPRYSIIRVVSPEAPKPKKPLIVEDAPARKTVSVAPKTFTDPELSRSATALIRENEEDFKKKSSSTPRIRGGEAQDFKSTDFLRRERVYQPKKKKISLGKMQNKTQLTTAGAHKRVVEVDSQISVEDMAHQMSVKAHQVAQKLQTMGVERPEEVMDFDEWILDLETAQLLAAEFEYEVKNIAFDEAAIIEGSKSEAELEEAKLPARSAVVTIMGHVDHGKTSLLDIIRRARVAAGEAGGITQHIGAYMVNVADAAANLQSLSAESDGKKEKKKDKKTKDAKKPAAKAAKAGALGQLTFLDTPGHAAFTSMRSRGAQITDIVILVVSAVDGVMPQTKEAIEHAKAAEVPLIVAVNKIDLPEANPDRIKQQLAEQHITPEDWGGDTIFVHVSAKTGEGVDKLLEMIQLQAEVLELKARNEGPAEGAVIEARLDKGRGPLATALISSGLLEVGQYVVAGAQVGKVRALIDDKGKNTAKAGPSTPVEILGLGGVPEAGDSINVVPDERAARALADHRTELRRKAAQGGTLTLEDLYTRMNSGQLRELPLIIKSDVKGSAEAIHASLLKLPQDKVKLKILSTGVGGISESDVLLASASKAVIIGFNVRPDNKGQAEAERLGIEVKTYDIIYNLIDDVTKAMEGLLAPTIKETVGGRAEVRDVFNLTKSGVVAGCSVIKGKIQRSNQVRLIRDGRVIYTGKLSGLRRFKDDAREVAEGFECGISIENFSDIKKGDIVEAFVHENVATRLTESSPSS